MMLGEEGCQAKWIVCGCEIEKDALSAAQNLSGMTTLTTQRKPEVCTAFLKKMVFILQLFRRQQHY